VLFDLYFRAFGTSLRECFGMARDGGRVLRPGKFIRVYHTRSYDEE
jgi:hypothetical protein